MKKKENTNHDQNLESSEMEELLKARQGKLPISNSLIPKTFAGSRAFFDIYSDLEADFFTQKGQGKSYSCDHFLALCYSILEKLYYDSYAAGKIRMRKGTPVKNMDNTGMYVRAADTQYVGMDISSKYIIENGKGLLDTRNLSRLYAEFDDLIRDLDSTRFYKLGKNKRGLYHFLLKDMGGRVGKGGEFHYGLAVNEKFCDMIDGYGLFYKDAMQKIAQIAGRKNHPIFKRLLFLLRMQNISKVFAIKLEALLSFLRVLDAYKEHPARIMGKYDKHGDPIDGKVGYVPRAMNIMREIKAIYGWHWYPEASEIHFCYSEEQYYADGADPIMLEKSL